MRGLVRYTVMRPSLVILAILLVAACGGSDSTAQLKELQRVKAGPMDILLLAPGDALKQGKGNFVLEFRDASGNLVDVGTVMVGASMPMPGMAPMFGECMVTPSAAKGRFDVSSDLGMAGTWRLQIAWDGPAGKGSASLPGSAL
jgi:YtkA-like protein